MKNTTLTILSFMVICNFINCSKESIEDPNTVKNVIGTVDNFASCNTDNNNQAYQIRLEEGLQETEIIVTASLPDKFQEIGLEIKFDMVSSTEGLTLCTSDYIANQFKKIKNVTLK